MHSLDWIGKEAVVNHHREVPYRLLHCDKALSTIDDQDASAPAICLCLFSVSNAERLAACLRMHTSLHGALAGLQ